MKPIWWSDSRIAEVDDLMLRMILAALRLTRDTGPNNESLGICYSVCVHLNQCYEIPGSDAYSWLPIIWGKYDPIGVDRPYDIWGQKVGPDDDNYWRDGRRMKLVNETIELIEAHLSMQQ